MESIIVIILAVPFLATFAVVAAAVFFVRGAKRKISQAEKSEKERRGE